MGVGVRGACSARGYSACDEIQTSLVAWLHMVSPCGDDQGWPRTLSAPSAERRLGSAVVCVCVRVCACVDACGCVCGCCQCSVPERNLSISPIHSLPPPLHTRTLHPLHLALLYLSCLTTLSDSHLHTCHPLPLHKTCCLSLVRPRLDHTLPQRLNYRRPLSLYI